MMLYSPLANGVNGAATGRLSPEAAPSANGLNGAAIGRLSLQPP
jgi:hypothetical protein